LWFYSVSPGKCKYSISTRALTVPSRSLLIHQPF
jgi:hypothetical protein